MSPVRVFGWSPPSSDADDEPRSPRPQVITFRLARRRAPAPTADAHDAWCPVDKLSPTSSASSLLTEFGQYEDEPPAPARKGDPNYIARPRNSFVIFRCEFCKKHLSAAKKRGGANARPAQLRKTLSKQAAEAWRALSAEDKQQYMDLADKEKKEHAIRYPHYRYRPARRGRSRLSRDGRAGRVLPRPKYEEDDDDYVPPSSPSHDSEPAARVPSPPPSSSGSSSSSAASSAASSPAIKPRPTSWLSAMPVNSALYTIPEGVNVQDTEPLFLDLPQQKAYAPLVAAPKPTQPNPSQSATPLDAVADAWVNWSGAPQAYEGASSARATPTYSGMVANDSRAPSTVSPYPSPYALAYPDSGVSTPGASTSSTAYTGYEIHAPYNGVAAATYRDSTSYVDQAAYAPHASYAPQTSYADHTYASSSYAAPAAYANAVPASYPVTATTHYDSYATSGTVHPAYLHAPLDAERATAMQQYYEGLARSGIPAGDVSHWSSAASYGDASTSYAAPYSSAAPVSVPYDAAGMSTPAQPFDAAGYDTTYNTAGANAFTYGDAYGHASGYM
ncbi:hypothetical protein BD626DRAFT_545145 [Schizophyllum amplum]|uniref:HMG box domain-containing protein n=1 Tax=Schizophyllum amplum TaxID=97359 RepID=A0A550CSR6_9AGAR|nr:hypothetical protein BD626DRAFT_545145 [Auriculariopsis ampla]